MTTLAPDHAHELGSCSSCSQLDVQIPGVLETQPAEPMTDAEYRERCLEAVRRLGLSRPIVLPMGVEFKILEPSDRTCRFCYARVQSGRECSNCGAPDDGKRGLLEMAPVGLPFA